MFFHLKYSDWNTLSANEKKQKREECYDIIDKQLHSKKQKLTLFAPQIAGEKCVTIEQIGFQKNTNAPYRR